MKKYGVIFDCDGTLVNSLGQALESFNYALAKIGEPPRKAEEIKKFFGRAADRIFLGVLGDEKKAMAAFNHYFDHQSQLALTMSLFPGIQELLDDLKVRGVPMAVVTGRHERDLAVILRPHKLHEYFVTLVADNQLPNSKPAPDGILIAAECMKLDPALTYYVGDSVIDIQAAKAAGAKGVAALWDPLAKAEAMKEEQPYFMAKTPHDLLALFQRPSSRK